MPAANTKANYKTYEAQARMVRAIVAAHPEVKWNYKDIAKYFGQSTADGIQFQFRTIKKDADTLRKVEGEGGNVANCLFAGSSTGPNTPSKPTPSRGAGSRSGATAKRSRAVPAETFIKRSESDDEDDELNYSDMDNTPSKRVKTMGPARNAKSRTPSRRAATKAGATIAASAQLESSESPVEGALTPLTDSTPAPPVTANPASLFGTVEQRHHSFDDKSALFHSSSTFTNTGADEFFGHSAINDVPPYTGHYDEFEGDGEI